MADYDKALTADAAHLDQVGEQAANDTTVKSKPVKEEHERTQHGNQTWIKDVGVMGMLPGMDIDIGYATGKAEEFKVMAAETDAVRSTMTGSKKSGEGIAFKSQIKMMNNYNDDVDGIKDASREYLSTAPLGNMAVQSYAKLQAVGQTIGVDEGFALDAKETAALGPASRTVDGRGMLQDGAGQSVKSAAAKVSAQRTLVLSAGENMAAVADRVVLRKLKEELETEKGKKEDIEKKIEKVANVVGYLDKAGAVMAGGAGLVAGESASALAAKELDEGTVVNPTMRGAKEVGEKVEKTGGPLETIAKIGMTAYYQKDLDKIQGKIETIKQEIPGREHEAERQEVQAAKDNFDGISSAYGNAVDDYKTVVNNRRESMGAIGAKTDKAVDPKGDDPLASQAMVYTATAYETQSFLDTAMHAGARTKKKADEVDSQMTHRRNEKWGSLDDAMDVTNTPRKEGESGPDIQDMHKLRHLIDSWMVGAANVSKDVDRQVNEKASHVMKAVGYSGSY
ncbi:MAG: hypothetical protein ABI467_25270 [Kofleriaceae bacterium]